MPRAVSPDDADADSTEELIDPDLNDPDPNDVDLNDADLNEPDPSDSDASSPKPVDHDPTGLQLATSIARSLGAQVRRQRRAKRDGRTEPRVSGAHPDDRDPQPLAAAMDRLVDAKGWSTEISVHTLLARWPALVGPVNAAHSTPVSYADAVLTVRADSTVWASSLRAIAPQLVALLNDRLGDGTVARVHVRGPDAPSWKKGRLSVRDGRGPRDTYG